MRAIVEHRFSSPNLALSRGEIETINAEVRDPQHRIVRAMGRLLSLVPTDLDDELLLEDARAFCQRFFPWYNLEHRHSGIAMLTPDAKPLLKVSDPGAALALLERVLGAEHRSEEALVVRLSGVTTAFVPLGGLPLVDDRLLGDAR